MKKLQIEMTFGSWIKFEMLKISVYSLVQTVCLLVGWAIFNWIHQIDKWLLLDKLPYWYIVIISLPTIFLIMLFERKEIAEV